MRDRASLILSRKQTKFSQRDHRNCCYLSEIIKNDVLSVSMRRTFVLWTRACLFVPKGLHCGDKQRRAMPVEQERIAGRHVSLF